MEPYLIAAFLLVGLGMALIVGEFILPTGGFLMIAAVIFFAVSCLIIFIEGTPTEATISIITMSLGVPAAFYALFATWKRFSLKSGLDVDAGATIVSSILELSTLQSLKGRYGKTVTPMKPSGTVEIEGRRVDAVTEGMMLDSNVWVKCVGVKANNVIVRQVDASTAMNDLEFDGMGEPNPGNE